MSQLQKGRSIGASYANKQVLHHPPAVTLFRCEIDGPRLGLHVELSSESIRPELAENRRRARHADHADPRRVRLERAKLDQVPYRRLLRPQQGGCPLID